MERRSESFKDRLLPSALLVACLTSAAGCVKPSPDAAGANPPKTIDGAAAPAVAIPADERPDERQVAAFAAEFVERLRADDLPGLQRLTDTDALLERVLGDLAERTTARERAALKAERPSEAIYGSITALLRTGSRIQYLGVVDDAVGRAVLLRVFDLEGENGFDYLKLYLRGAGAPKVVDTYTYGSGELLSVLLHRNLLAQLAVLGRAPADLPASELAAAQATKRIAAIRAQVVAGNYEGADRLYQRLSKIARQDPIVMQLRIRIASGLDEAAYRQALEDHRARFGDDPSKTLILLDGFYLEGDYDAAAAALARLDRDVGGDPYLDCMRAGALRSAGKQAEALQAVAESLKRYDGSVKLDPAVKEELHWAAVEATLAQEDHDATLDWLIRTDAVIDVIDDLSGYEEYARFVASPQYRQWQQHEQAETD